MNAHLFRIPRRAMLCVLTLSMACAFLCRPQLRAETEERPALPLTFSLTERSGRPVTADELRGQVWVASFIFTRCGGPCPKVSASMEKLQADLRRFSNVKLVTITVDPEHDTPEVLSRYADHYHADPERWLFLTGQPTEVYSLINEQFFLLAKPNEGADRTPGNEIMHDDRLVLVDATGQCRGYFKGVDYDLAGRRVGQLASLKEGVIALAQNPATLLGIRVVDLPHLNSGLNTLSALLVLFGYRAVRQRMLGLHKACMLAAFTLSALFLASYLYYHFVVRRGEPSRFTDRAAPDWAYALYITILLSHTMLAIVAAPMILRTIYVGLRNRLPAHRTWAKWTLPIWLYVSITGVIVYLMLYRLYPLH